MTLPSQARRVHHKKRGSSYSVLMGIKTDQDYIEGDHVSVLISDPIRGDRVFLAMLQSSTRSVVPKGSWLIVYYADTAIYCREVLEFNDGRFTVLEGYND